VVNNDQVTVTTRTATNSELIQAWERVKGRWQLLDDRWLMTDERWLMTDEAWW
jgi:hypothetical protein